MSARHGPRAEDLRWRQQPPAWCWSLGVNGVGKTTTVGKIARVMVADGQSLILGAADTSTPPLPEAADHLG